MTTAITAFMNAVLGEDATTALMKAGERSSAIASVVGPRTVVGWVNLAARWDYNGVVPGLDESYLAFTKNEDGLSGAIAIGDQQLDFENAQPENLAAMMCVGLGCAPDLSKSEGATAAALAQLGETIDLMVKTRVVRLLKAETPQCGKCHKFYSRENVSDRCPHCDEALQKSMSPDALRADCETCQGSGKVDGEPCECQRDAIEKAELPGRQAKPIGQDAPQGQQAPTPTAPRRMATKAPTAVKLTKSMAERKCSVCEAAQFSKRGDFTGCFCLRELGRFAKSEATGDGYLVTFGPEWTKKNIALLLDIVGERE